MSNWDRLDFMEREELIFLFKKCGYKNIDAMKKHYNDFCNKNNNSNVFDGRTEITNQMYVTPQDNTRVVRPIDTSRIFPNVATKTPEQAVERMTTRETGAKIPFKRRELLGFLPELRNYRNNCVLTVTDSYGFNERSNDRFLENHQNYGFQQIPRTNYAPVPGDIIQQHRDSLDDRPHHMGMYTGNNTVHHAPGRFFHRRVRADNLFSDDINEGWINRGDTTRFTPFRRK